MQLLIEIAIQLLRARFKQTMVAAVGVTFGIAMFVTLLSFMTGLNNMLDGLIGNRTPHIRLYNEIEASAKQPIQKVDSSKHFIHSVKVDNSRQSIYNAQQIMRALDADNRVLGYSRKINAPIFFTSGTVEIAGTLNGIDALKELAFYHFKDYVTSGNPADVEQINNSIILGKPLAEKLQLAIGDNVSIATLQGDQFRLKVVGYYQSGIADFDKTQCFTSVKTAQKILGKAPNYITDIQVKLHDLNAAPTIASEFQSTFETTALPIQTANAQFETGTNVRNIISYAVGITLLIVAGFGIYNILNMMIYEKMDTIAILKATGFSGKDVKRIFLFISLSIGIVGLIAGLLIGTLLTILIHQIPFNSPALPTIETFPIDRKPIFYAIATVFAFITTYFAGWFPARKASKVDPVIIIRGK